MKFTFRIFHYRVTLPENVVVKVKLVLEQDVVVTLRQDEIIR